MYEFFLYKNNHISLFCPRISRIYTNYMSSVLMATWSVARIFTNSMRVMLFYDDNSNFTNLTNSLILFV